MYWMQNELYCLPRYRNGMISSATPFLCAFSSEPPYCSFNITAKLRTAFIMARSAFSMRKIAADVFVLCHNMIESPCSMAWLSWQMSGMTLYGRLVNSYLPSISIRRTELQLKSSSLNLILNSSFTTIRTPFTVIASSIDESVRLHFANFVADIITLRKSNVTARTAA